MDLAAGLIGERQIADRHNMRRARRGVLAAPIGKCVKLLDMAQRDPNLLSDPLAQANFHRAVLVGHKWAKRQTPWLSVGGVFHQPTLKYAAIGADDCCAEVDENLRIAGL